MGRRKKDIPKSLFQSPEVKNKKPPKQKTKTKPPKTKTKTKTGMFGDSEFVVLKHIEHAHRRGE